MRTSSANGNGITGWVAAVVAGFVIVSTAILLGTFSAGGWGSVMGLMWFWMVTPLLVLLLLAAFFVDKIEAIGKRQRPGDRHEAPPTETDYEKARDAEVVR